MNSENIQSNHQIELAAEFLRTTGVNIFLTGRAGTGKTTFLRRMVESLNKRVVVAAPTGVAALNARGVTLHSLFQLPFGPNVPKSEAEAAKDWAYRKMGRRKLSLIRSIELLVIDEISMVRSDLLDAVDQTLRRVRRNSRPFGGVQLLMIGDMQQLSPICHDDEWQLLSPYYDSPYFFDSNALKGCDYITIELKEIFRQRDRSFTYLLNAVRDNAITPEVERALNTRYIPNFLPSEDEGYITLTTHNNRANSINSEALARLQTTSRRYQAQIKGDYPEWAYPNDSDLELKVGAQVILLKNDSSVDKLYYNGMIGRVVSLGEKVVSIAPSSGEPLLELSALTWERIEYNLNPTTGEVEESVVGSYTQLPLKCAWAITIHKSQGLSFERAIIDAGSSFAYGQVYVALSRCRSFEGMVLRSPIRATSVVSDRLVEQFNQRVTESEPSSEALAHYQRNYYFSILSEIFNFENFNRLTYTISKLINASLFSSYPKLCDCFRELVQASNAELQSVGTNFGVQLHRIIKSCDNYECDSHLAERLSKASAYFITHITPFKTLADEATTAKVDAKDVEKRLKSLLEEFAEEYAIKECSLRLCAEGFSCEEYLKRKVALIAERAAVPTKSSSKKGAPSAKISSDIINAELYENLVEWRRDKAQQFKVAAYQILPNRSLVEIQATLPTTIEKLKIISGIGEYKLTHFGDEVIELVRQFTLFSEINVEEYHNQKIGFVEAAEEPQSTAKSKREPKSKAPKEPKEESFRVTQRLFDEGLSIDEIVAQRALGRATIVSHLGKCVELDELELEEVIGRRSIELVWALLEEGLTLRREMYERLDGAVTYEEINLVIAKFRREERDGKENS